MATEKNHQNHQSFEEWIVELVLNADKIENGDYGNTLLIYRGNEKYAFVYYDATWDGNRVQRIYNYYRRRGYAVHLLNYDSDHDADIIDAIDYALDLRRTRNSE